MTASEPPISGRAAELRRAFDLSFVEPRRITATDTEDYLAIEAGGDPHALRLSEIAGLHAEKAVTPVPGQIAGFIGIAGFRGKILPVYDLARLLDYPALRTPQWIAIAECAPVAFAFETFVGHARIPIVAPGGASGEAADGRHIRGVVRVGETPHSVIHLPSIVAAIRKRDPALNSRKEH